MYSGLRTFVLSCLLSVIFLFYFVKEMCKTIIKGPLGTTKCLFELW